MDSKEKDALIKRVEDKMDSGDTFSMKEIRDIMRKTGKSFAQVVQSTKKLDKDIKIGSGEAINDTILADVFEAFVAALYLDQGFEFTKKFVLDIITRYIEKGITFLHDYKSTLQELVQTVKKSVIYEVVEETGPSHNKSFTSVVKIPALKVAGLNISGETIVTIAACILIVVGLTLFINKTKPGQAMLAVSEDKGAAQLMGINVDGTIALTFAIGSGLAAIAGVLLCSAYPSLTPYTGSMPGIKAFVAAVFGGIGSIPGAMIGGILLGIIEIFGKAYISSQMADAIVFAVLIVVLLVKPTGLLGKQIQEKV